MTAVKKIKWSNILFILIIVIFLVPQTRKPIQVAINKMKVAIFSPSAFAKADQTKVAPFTYKVQSIDGIARDAAVGQGKVTFISYWATWCPPCIAELSSIEKLYADYGNRVDFLLITSEDPAVVQKFLDKKGFNIPAVTPLIETPEILFERTIPTNYLIDKDGAIIVKEKGAADWNSEGVRAVLEELLTR